MGVITINNKSYSGSSVIINDGKVIIDGKEANTANHKTINITVTGDVTSINADHCAKIEVKGNAGSIKTMSGDVKCGNVTGSVSSMSGDISCKQIQWNASTMSGDIIK